MKNMSYLPVLFFTYLTFAQDSPKAEEKAFIIVEQQGDGVLAYPIFGEMKVEKSERGEIKVTAKPKRSHIYFIAGYPNAKKATEDDVIAGVFMVDGTYQEENIYVVKYRYIRPLGVETGVRLDAPMTAFEARTWRNVKGQSITGTLEKIVDSGKKVVISKGGEKHTFSVSSLSAEDLAFVKSIARE